MAATDEPTFNQFWKESATRLMSSAQLLSSLVRHGGSIGSSREFLVRECLKSYVPTRFRVATGFVINDHGQSSKQQDVIIFDAHRFAPLFSEGDLVVVPAQAVVSCIEVKSTLDGEKLKSSLENGLSVREMRLVALSDEMVPLAATVCSQCWDACIEKFGRGLQSTEPKEARRLYRLAPCWEARSISRAREKFTHKCPERD